MSSPLKENPLWSFLSSVASTWGGDRADIPALKLGNKLIQTGDALRKYREARRLEKTAIGGAMREEVKKRGLRPLGSSSHIDRLCLRYAEHTPTEKVFKAIDGETLIRASLGGGVKLYLHTSEREQETSVHNIYIHPGTIDKVQRAVADLVWSVEEDCALQLVTKKFWDSTYLDVVPVSGHGDYVSGDEEVETALESMLDRTRKFLEAGFARKVLLYGPPGTGKTTLAHKLAEGLGGRLLQMSGKNIRNNGSGNLLQFIDMLRPDVILLDDIDRNMGAMESLLEVLGQADHVLKGRMTIVGTVNAIKQLDPALLRPGRFDEVLEMSEPEPAYLRRVIEHYADKFKVSLDPRRMAQDMEGFTPADVREVLISMGVVGEEVYEVEVARVRKQRELHSGERCEEYLSRSRNDEPHPSDAESPAPVAALR